MDSYILQNGGGGEGGGGRAYIPHIILKKGQKGVLKSGSVDYVKIFFQSSLNVVAIVRTSFLT